MADFHDAAPTPGSPEPGVAERRRAAVLSGHVSDEAGARRALSDPDPSVRAAGVGALSRLGRVDLESLEAALSDPSPEVRRRATEAAATPELGARLVDRLVALLDDPDALVAETAAATLGELPSEDRVVDALSRVATGHAEPLCRESAVAALGSLGHRAGLPAILKATADRPAVRRRAVIALAPFEGEEVEAALEAALQDRDWQVRQAAEDLLGRGDN